MSTIRIERLKAVGEHAPNFKFRFTYVSGPMPPFRAYLHGAGIETFAESQVTELAAKEHLLETLDVNNKLLEDAVFLLAAIWCKEGDQMIDLFRYADVVPDWKENPGNPDFLDPLVFKNGVYQPDAKVRTCEDTIIVLGAEGKHRRKSKNLTDYMKRPPDNEGLVNY